MGGKDSSKGFKRKQKNIHFQEHVAEMDKIVRRRPPVYILYAAPFLAILFFSLVSFSTPVFCSFILFSLSPHR